MYHGEIVWMAHAEGDNREARRFIVFDDGKEHKLIPIDRDLPPWQNWGPAPRLEATQARRADRKRNATLGG